VSARYQAAALSGLVLVLAVLAGLTLARNSLWNDSVALWEDAVRKAPRTYAAYYGLADAHRSVGDCESAAEPFQAAIRMRPQNPDAYLGLAACQQDLARPDDARSTLRAGLENAGTDARLSLALAALEEQRQNSSEALRLCRQALAQNPRDDQAAACVERNEAAAVQ
jgi:tetratricopeptide (TPR) repeat protein